MPDRFVIRQERPDQPAVMALLADLDSYLASLYPPDANHILSVQELLSPEVSFFVARDGDQAVATGAVRRMQGEPATASVAYGEIKRMYVDPARRGERLGVRMLETLEARLRADGDRLVLLETGPEQTAALRLYERCGYTQRGVFGLYPDNGLSVYYAKWL